MKRWIGNILASLIAVVVGGMTIMVSLRYLKEPEAGLWQTLTDPSHNGGAVRDWVVLVLSGLTTATIAFFVVWGHFQDDPEADTSP